MPVFLTREAQHDRRGRALLRSRLEGDQRKKRQRHPCETRHNSPPFEKCFTRIVRSISRILVFFAKAGVDLKAAEALRKQIFFESARCYRPAKCPRLRKTAPSQKG